MSEYLMSFRADARDLAQVAALPAAVVAKQKHRTAVLYGVLIEAAGDGVTFAATDTDVSLRLALACEVEIAGRALVDAAAFADALKALAKVKGARTEIALGDSGETLFLISGRSRIRLSTMAANDWPAGIDAWEAAETSEAPIGQCADVKASPAYDDGPERELSEHARKILAKVAKRVGADTAARVDRNDSGDGEAARVRFVANGVTFGAGLYEPDLFKVARRSLYFYGCDARARSEAETYLRNLAGSLALERVGEHCGELIEHKGRAVGMTFGGCRRDYAESREMPEGWQPAPECLWGEHSATVDGVDYWNARQNGPGCPDVWLMHYKPERMGELIYDDGAYSLPMPAAQRRPLSVLTVDVDGQAMPLKCKFSGSCTAEIELTADQVREMCGPVDPSTFVDIPAVACHHGRVIATGEAAERFNAMEADYFKTSRRALKNCRNMAERVLTADNLAEQWRAKVAQFLEIGRDPGFVVDAREVVEAPAPAEPDNVVRVDFAGHAPHVAEIPTSAASRDFYPTVAMSEGAACRRVGQPRAVPDHFKGKAERDWLAGYDEQSAAARAPDDVEETPESEWVTNPNYPDAPENDPMRPVPVPAALDNVAARLERLEAALGLVAQPKRSPTHAAAIRRAWRMRREMRERAALDHAALLQVNGYNRIMREENERIAERLKRAEDFATGERAELVAEIDRQRATATAIGERLIKTIDDAGRIERARQRIRRRATAVRRDLARTRAALAGMAGNVQAMTARAAADAATIERLGGDTRPRFILNAR
jgi:hypothetical protein